MHYSQEGLFGATYSTESLSEALEEVLGGKTLGDLITDVVVPTFSVAQPKEGEGILPVPSWHPVIFHNIPEKLEQTIMPEKTRRMEERNGQNSASGCR